MSAASTVPLTITVNDAVLRWPHTLAVFNEHGIDACCGGALLIEEAARRHQLDPCALQERLDDAVHAAGAGDGAVQCCALP